MAAGLVVQDTVTGPMAATLGQGASVVAPSGDVTMNASGVFTIADDAVTAAKSKTFASTEQTGTGSPQNVAHGLGATPSIVMIAVTEDPAGSGFDVAEGTHTSTNVVVTVTSGVKFKVFAWA